MLRGMRDRGCVASSSERTGPAEAGGPWGPMEKDSLGESWIGIHVSTFRMGEVRELIKESLGARDTKVMGDVGGG